MAVAGGVILESEGRISLRELRDRYFTPLAPFTERDGKKSEFPDAIALMALEHFAREQQSMVLAVSRNGDWHDFAVPSAHIIVVDDLAKMLESEIGGWLENCDFTPDRESEFLWDARCQARRHSTAGRWKMARAW